MPNTKKAKKPKRHPLKKLIHGFIIGNADNDPAGITTYTLTGARTGLSLVLFHLLSTPLLINAQAICARIGDVTKKGLATNIRLYYGKPIALILTFFVVLANLATLSADFVGMASGLNLLFPQINLIFFLPLIAAFLWYIVVYKSYQQLARVLIGLGIIFLAYIAAAFLTQPDWLDVGRQIFRPQLQFTPSFWLMAVAMLGTTITPFLFYWQVTEEVEDHPSVKNVKTEIGEVSFGLVFAILISTSIIITSALTLHSRGITVTTISEAALALRPFAGELSYLLFSIGLIGSGMLAIPVLTSTSAYTIAETFNWRTGLNKKVNQAKGFYIILTISFFIGLSVALLKVNPIKMLFYSQVLNGLITPFILVAILKLATKKVIMKKYTIGRTQKTLGWLTVIVMIAAALAALVA